MTYFRAIDWYSNFKIGMRIGALVPVKAHMSRIGVLLQFTEQKYSQSW